VAAVRQRTLVLVVPGSADGIVGAAVDVSLPLRVSGCLKRKAGRRDCSGDEPDVLLAHPLSARTASLDEPPRCCAAHEGGS
jgi:hypothetical protein